MTFFEVAGLEIGKNVSESSVLWQTLALWPLPSQRGWGRFGALDGCLLARLLGRLSGGRCGVCIRANVGPEADAARRETRATSERPNLSDRPDSSERPDSRRWHGKLRACSTSLGAGFIFEFSDLFATGLSIAAYQMQVGFSAGPAVGAGCKCLKT